MSGFPLVATLLFSVLAALGLGIVAGLFVRGSILGRRAQEVERQAEGTKRHAEETERQAEGTKRHAEEAQRHAEEAERRAALIVEEAEQRRKNLELESKEEALRARSAAEAEARERRQEGQQQEQRLAQREEQLERRVGSLDRKEQEVEALEQKLEVARQEEEELKQKALRELESVAGLTHSDAHDIVIKRAEDQSQMEIAKHYFDLDQEHKEEAEHKARKYVALAIQRLSSDVVSESTITTVPLPNDEMKGRLIGREGRNIRAIEQALGVDLIIDDTHEAVSISCFDPVRREVARVAIKNLVQDGRIHPTRVEEMAKKAEEEVDQTIKEAGEEAVFDAGVRGLNPDLIKLLGRLKYRTSYGGNVLQHSVEACHLAGMIAAEMGADEQTAKMGALLHDIGKALSHEFEGPHAEIGGEMAAKYGIPEPVRRAIMEHHDEEKGSIEAFIVVAADAISSARPGARKDTLERYVQRLQALEEVARSFDGVEKCFAIQAGREVRIMVKPDEIDDVSASKLAHDITQKIQESLVFPGQIKVVVIRETRAVEFAR